ERQGAIFLLCFALGWVTITVLSLLTARKFVWWPLIPGGIMALIGGSLLAGGAALEALKWFGMFGWPLLLIGIGLYIIFRRRNA
ncbi:MAG TPA: hypothetical protein VI547_10565, partial [Anaerolineales bacterium]|nr:hypothetical protein [Anaerolineales bacterium]